MVQPPQVIPIFPDDPSREQRCVFFIALIQRGYTLTDAANLATLAYPRPSQVYDENN